VFVERKDHRLQTNNSDIDLGAHFRITCLSSTEVLWLRHSTKSKLLIAPTYERQMLEITTVTALLKTRRLSS